MQKTPDTNYRLSVEMQENAFSIMLCDVFNVFNFSAFHDHTQFIDNIQGSPKSNRMYYFFFDVVAEKNIFTPRYGFQMK